MKDAEKTSLCNLQYDGDQVDEMALSLLINNHRKVNDKKAGYLMKLNRLETRVLPSFVNRAVTWLDKL